MQENWNNQVARHWKKAAVGLGGAAAIGLVIAATRPGGSTNASEADIAVVQRGDLTISVTESGTIKPRDQEVLKNRLDDPASILFIVEEGELVKKGDLLVELDVTRVENDLVERRIRLQNAEAELIHAEENLIVVKNQAEADIQQAELNFQFARQDLQKYEEGEYPKLVKEAEAKITLAQEELGQAEEKLKWSKVLFEEKYLSQTELQQDELAAKKVRLNLELAESALDLLETYTYQRQIDQLESDVKQAELALERTKRMAKANIAQAEARLAASRAEVKEDTDRVERLDREMENAKMYAPIDGMVIYASSVRERWRRNDDPIRTGTIVRERDDIIYLPTASEFDATIKIPEVALNKVHPGMPVKLTVDALPEANIGGVVKSIAQLPDAESRYLNPNLKLYETTIAVNPISASLRNGMSCRAEVIIEKYEDVLYVPLQAIVRLGGKTVVFQPGDEGQPVIQEVEVGLDNARFVHVIAGLAEGDRVLLTPPISPSAGGLEEKPEESEPIPPLEEPPLEAT